MDNNAVELTGTCSDQADDCRTIGRALMGWVHKLESPLATTITSNVKTLTT